MQPKTASFSNTISIPQTLCPRKYIPSVLLIGFVTPWCWCTFPLTTAIFNFCCHVTFINHTEMNIHWINIRQRLAYIYIHYIIYVHIYTYILKKQWQCKWSLLPSNIRFMNSTSTKEETAVRITCMKCIYLPKGVIGIAPIISRLIILLQGCWTKQCRCVEFMRV